MTMRASHLARVAGCVVLLGACHDAARDPALAPHASSPTTTAALVIETPSEGEGVIVLLRVNPARDAGRIGSLTASIAFDSSRVTFVGDESPNDGAMRAVHADGRVVRIAVASSNGIETDAVARLRFTARDRRGLRALSLQVTEMHQLDAANAARAVSVLPVAGLK